jgi:lysozyme
VTSKSRRKAAVVVSSAVVVLVIAAALIASGIVWPNRLFASGHPTRGVDVSSYQGTIDWTVLGGEDIDFAIIKSTEGSGSQDSRFAENWAGARDTDLLVGAYHFLSFDSEGESQAQNVIDTVPDAPGSLPVTVDVEFYADYFEHPPTRSRVRDILDPLLAALEDHYGSPPIIYTTSEAYDRYIRDAYPDNPIWIRSVVVPPRLSDQRDWTFWQYSHRDRLPGYDGEESYIDMNVFTGSLDELRALAE